MSLFTVGLDLSAVAHDTDTLLVSQPDS